MNCYFLTGGTGAVGARILEELLREEVARVYLLVRADSCDAAERRKHDLLRLVFGDAGEAYARRIEAVRGDIKLSRFGLSAAQYHGVIENCRRIIHCAGLVRMNLPIEQARESAVSAARNVLELARALADRASLEKVEFVSTVGVGGRLREVPESWIGCSRTFHNTYEQAKAEAEGYVHDSIAEGLPITVHRPSMVVGDSETGRITSFQVFYHLCEFLSGIRSRGLFPSFGAAKLDTVPVDYVARAIVWSCSTSDTAGRIMHLCSGPSDAISIADLQRLVVARYAAEGIPTPAAVTLPRAWFRALVVPMGVLAPARIRKAVKTLPIFLDYLASEQIFQNVQSRKILAAHGIDMPPTVDYLSKAITFYLERR